MKMRIEDESMDIYNKPFTLKTFESKEEKSISFLTVLNASKAAPESDEINNSPRSRKACTIVTQKRSLSSSSN